MAAAADGRRTLTPARGGAPGPLTLPSASDSGRYRTPGPPAATDDRNY